MPPPKAPRRKSLVVKRSIILGGRGGHKTSVGLEDAFWVALKSIAAAQGSSAAQLIDRIDNERRERQHSNLSSAIVNGRLDACAINETMDFTAGITVLTHNLTSIVDPERVSPVNPQRII